VDPHLHQQSYGFVSGMYKEEMSQLKQSLAAAVKAERSCALKDKAAWAEERAKLERQLVQTKTKIDRAEREKRDRETLAAAKKAEREKRAQGKGAWHMKKGERAGAVIPPVTVTLTMQGPSETCFSSHASRPSRRAEARWRSRRRWTRSGKRSLPRRRRVVLVCSRACPRSVCIPSPFACARQPAWWGTPQASVTDQVDTERTVSRWNFSPCGVKISKTREPGFIVDQYPARIRPMSAWSCIIIHLGIPSRPDETREHPSHHRIYRPPLPAPPFMLCLDTLGTLAPPADLVDAFLASFSRFSDLALVMAACRAAARTSGLAVRLARMEARSAPTTPRCGVSDPFHALHHAGRSSLVLDTHLDLDVLPAPLLGNLLGDTLLVHPGHQFSRSCAVVHSARKPSLSLSASGSCLDTHLRYTWVQAIFRGFFRWRKRDSALALRNRKVYRISMIASWCRSSR